VKVRLTWAALILGILVVAYVALVGIDYAATHIHVKDDPGGRQ
jgi:hypothetical protein